MKRFDFVPTFILSIITAGIYSLYVWHVMSKTNNEIARQNGMPENKSFIVAFLLGCVTCSIYLIYWYYKFMVQQVQILQMKGRPVAISSSPVVLVIMMFIPILSFYVLCTNYNEGIM